MLKHRQIMNWATKFMSLGLLVFLFVNQMSAQSPVSSYNANIALTWNNVYLDIDRYAVGFRPGASATAAGYINLAAYETAVPGMPSYQSLEAALPGLVLPNPQSGAVYHWPTAVNAAYAYMNAQFFAYLQPTRPAIFNKIDSTRLAQRNIFAASTPSDVMTRSEAFGTAIATAIYTWFATDPVAYQAWLNPQPTSYIPPSGPGLWQPTTPDFSRAVYPYYGGSRTFALPQSEKLALPPLPYSETSGSTLRTEAEEVYAAVNNIRSGGPGSAEQEWIAEFWSDDLTNLTYSPPARVIAIANQLVTLENLNLEKALELYAKSGLAMHDVAVAVWYSKYYYNIERPVSYIRRVLGSQDPNAASWVSALDNPLTGAIGVTPAFPAYPSGHSGFGGVMSGIFSSMFENTPTHPGTYTFTDNSHLGRTEFNGTPRTFTSFSQMGQENADSRVPLGVHFRMDCTEGLRLGELASSRVIALPWKSTALSCDAITITPGAGSVVVAGLTAPINQVQIFNASWQRVFNCSGDCTGTTQTVNNLPAGTYYVKANYYTATWQPICGKDQYVTVTSGNPTCTTLPTIVCKNASKTLPTGGGSVSISSADVVQSSTAGCGTLTTVLSQSTFTSAGTFPVTVTVTNSSGLTASCTAQVTVTSSAVCTTLPTVVCKNASKTLPTGGGSVSISSADVVQSSTAGCGTLTTVLSQSAFTSAGTFPVTVTVTNSSGLTASCTAQVTVTSSAPATDCSAVSFVAGSSNITVNGLTAPINQVQIFNASWTRVFNCSGNCDGVTQTASGLTAGTYFVKASLYTAAWVPICSKEEFVTISSTSGGCTNPPTVVCKNVTAILQNGAAVISPADVTQSIVANCGTVTAATVSQTVFSAVGTYPVTVTATNSAGYSATCTAQVTVISNTTTPPATCNNNLLSNPGYENGLAGWWTFGNVSSTATSVSVGVRALENCDLVGAGSGQTVFATSGTTYTAKVMARISGTPSFAVVSMKFMNSNYQTIGSEITKNITTNAYTEYTLSGAAPVGTAYVQVWSWKSGGGCLFVDNWCLSLNGSNLIASQPEMVFHASKKGNHSSLRWVSNTGNLNDYFIIERSANNLDFEPMLKLEGRGEANETLSFEELDENPLAGKNYYRLRLVYLDGKEMLSETQLVEFPEVRDFTLFPNPAQENVFISLKSFEGEAVSIVLYNQVGEKVLQVQTVNADNNPVEINTSELENGFYVVRVQSASGVARSQKLVVQKNN